MPSTTDGISPLAAYNDAAEKGLCGGDYSIGYNGLAREQRATLVGHLCIGYSLSSHDNDSTGPKPTHSIEEVGECHARAKFLVPTAATEAQGDSSFAG